jgi:hypothetical protein
MPTTQVWWERNFVFGLVQSDVMFPVRVHDSDNILLILQIIIIIIVVL